MPLDAPIPPRGVRLRAFNDVDAQRTEILDRIRSAYATKFPLENDRYRIEMKNLRYPEKKYGIRDEKNAILKNQTLSIPLYGKLSLIDKTSNQVLDEQETVIARVPWLTHRGTYINNGNEYSLAAGQQRLKPGIYARMKDNGELEAHVNTVSGTGQGMRIFMEPETGVYRIMIGKSRMSLYPVLKGMGVDDQEIEKWWGREITEANRGKKEDTTTFSKFYSKFLGRRAKPDLDDKQKRLAILEELSRGEVDEDVSERTLGIRQKNLTPELLLRSSQKLLNIQKGLEEPDDRDSLANKNFVGPEDLFEERIKKDVGKLSQKLLSRSSYHKKLAGFHPGYFSPQLSGLIAGNSLSVHIDGINPIQILDFGNRVVQTGEGAIGDADAIPMSSRALHPTQAMTIDFIKTPESGSVGVDQRFASYAMKGSDRQIYFPLKNKKTGKLEYLTPAKMAQSIVGFPTPRRLMPEPQPQNATDMLRI
jgi:DNA-directed RNA polymerase beta subunit